MIRIPLILSLLALLPLMASCELPWVEDDSPAFATSDLAGTWISTQISRAASSQGEVVFDSAGTLIHWYESPGIDLFDFTEVTTSSFVDSEGDVTIHLTAVFIGAPLEVDKVDMNGPMNTSKSQVTLSVQWDYYYDGDLMDSDTQILLLER